MKGNIRKRGEKFIAEIMIQGQRKAKTFTTKRAAQKWVAETVAIFDGFPAYRETLTDLSKRYLAEVSSKKRGEKTENDRLALYQRKFPYVWKKRLDGLALKDFESIFAERLKEVEGSTVNRDINTINHLLNTGVRWRMLGKNPMTGLQRPPENEPRTRRISEDEIKRLLLALEYSEDQPINLQRQKTGWALLFAIETAMRQGEIAKTLWENVRLDKRYVHLPGAICKTGVARDVPLSPEAIRLIGRLDTDRKGLMLGGITADTISTMFRNAKKLAGVENLRFHDSRREATTRLSKKLHVLDLARVTGHRDIKQLMTYYNKDASELADSL